MATTGSLDAELRRQRLAGIVQRDGALDLERAAAELGVSAMTVRRDLAELETAGLVRRVRGGAVPAPRGFEERMATGAAAKRAIARKAAALVPPSGAVGFDASSTMGMLAGELREQDDLVIATNSYETFTILDRLAGVSAVLVGGERQPDTGSFVGMVACEAAASLSYSTFFASGAALAAGAGSSEQTLPEAQVKRSFAGVAARVVLCMSASKLGNRATAIALPWDRIDVLVTELDPADARLDDYRHLTELL
jgi:DeoR family transcriptional regulator, fructose operon transcriptional repressor